jgi:hypothetical protein
MGQFLDEAIRMSLPDETKKKIFQTKLAQELSKIDPDELHQTMASFGAELGTQAAQSAIGDMNIVVDKPRSALETATAASPSVSPAPTAKLPAAATAPVDSNPRDVTSALGNFMQSFGYGAIGKPVDAGTPQAGWQTYLGARLGKAVGDVGIHGEPLSAAPTYFNTKEENYKTESEIDKAARSYDRSLALAAKRSEMIDQRTEKKQKFQETLLDKKEQLKARDDLRQYASNASQVLRSLDNLELKTKSVLPGAGRGFLGQAQAKTQVALGRYSADKDIVRYEAAVNSELIPLARKLMEEKGPITEFDVARVEKGLGTPNLPLEDRLAIIADLRGKVKQAIEFKRQAAGMDSKEFGRLYNSLDVRTSGKTSSGNTFRKAE